MPGLVQIHSHDGLRLGRDYFHVCPLSACPIFYDVKSTVSFLRSGESLEILKLKWNCAAVHGLVRTKSEL